MSNFSTFTSIFFSVTAIACALFFASAWQKPRLAFSVLAIWMLAQAIISFSGFYTDTTSIPPRFVLLVLPPLVTIALLTLTRVGNNEILKLPPDRLTLLHVVRIPVEITLFLLANDYVVPKLMTFEGSNPDIISGITAPIMYYLGYRKKVLSNGILLAWNFTCLGLLANIVVTAVLSVPTPFQQLGFDHPNVAILYFPFVWLPAAVVPMVLLAHIAAIRQLMHNRK